ncbi:MAG: hypothetical protein C5S49_03370 [Candidatus Methanogaster sp.]|nr:MAG: hypothetical protein C5S49_03370 [ANME-2 cluster archaeon]
MRSFVVQSQNRLHLFFSDKSITINPHRAYLKYSFKSILPYNSIAKRYFYFVTGTYTAEIDFITIFTILTSQIDTKYNLIGISLAQIFSLYYSCMDFCNRFLIHRIY